MSPAAAAIERNRAAKAAKLAAWLHAYIEAGKMLPDGRGLTLDDVRTRFTPESWKIEAKNAGCNPPGSAESIEMVVRELERLEENDGR